MIELQDIPKDSIIQVDGQDIVFKHLDGLYSYCLVDNHVVQLHRFTPLKKVDNHYEIDEQKEN